MIRPQGSWGRPGEGSEHKAHGGGQERDQNTRLMERPGEVSDLKAQRVGQVKDQTTRLKGRPNKG